MVKFNNVHGVEISSWTIDNNELIYQKNGAWNKSDPFLFPSIGNSYKSIVINNKRIKHPRHGMFVNSNITFEKIDENTFKYVNNNQNYFDYKFDIVKKYMETNNELVISTKVINNDNVDFKFQLGYHLAFKIDVNSYIQFEKDSYNIHPVNAEGFVSEDTEKFITNKKWSIDFDVFRKKDSLVFANNQIKKLVLCNENYNLEIYIENNLSCVTIWTIEDIKTNNQYICIEPWTDLPTTKKSENVVEIKPKEELEYSYHIKYISNNLI